MISLVGFSKGMLDMGRDGLTKISLLCDFVSLLSFAWLTLRHQGRKILQRDRIRCN